WNVRPEFEHVGRRQQVLRLAVVDDGDGYRGLKIESNRQQIDSKRQSLGTPDRELWIEVNAAVLIGAEPIEPGGQAAVLRGVRARGTAFRFGQNHFQRGIHFLSGWRRGR